MNSIKPEFLTFVKTPDFASNISIKDVPPIKLLLISMITLSMMESCPVNDKDSFINLE